MKTLVSVILLISTASLEAGNSVSSAPAVQSTFSGPGNGASGQQQNPNYTINNRNGGKQKFHTPQQERKMSELNAKLDAIKAQYDETQKGFVNSARNLKALTKKHAEEAQGYERFAKKLEDELFGLPGVASTNRLLYEAVKEHSEAALALMEGEKGQSKGFQNERRFFKMMDDTLTVTAQIGDAYKKWNPRTNNPEQELQAAKTQVARSLAQRDSKMGMRQFAGAAAMGGGKVVLSEQLDITDQYVRDQVAPKQVVPQTNDESEQEEEADHRRSNK